MAFILLVDDDDLIGEIVSEALSDAGHVVGVCKDGLAAFDVLQVKQPKLVILDCNLPGMSGISLLAEMRRDARLWDKPVLMLTGRQSESDRQIAMYRGADSYMTKPFDPEALVAEVNTLLNRFQAAPEVHRA